MTNKPWLKSYPQSIPHSVDIHEYDTLISFFAERFKAYGALPAFTSMGKTISFAELDQMSTQFGAFLHSRGLEPGDKIALMMPNLLQYPIAFFGAMKAGLVVVNTNPLYTKREMLHQFADAEVKAIVIAENFASNLQAILSKTSIELTIVTSIGEMLGFPKAAITDFVIRRIKKMVPKYHLPNP
ncbi:MAG: AMP-binding protein, partial [Bacteroidota bacterium]